MRLLPVIRNPRLGDALLVALAAAFLFLHGIGGRSLRRASEGRVARVAQEMLDRGDWFVPHLNGAPRVQKPPLSSWLPALFGKLFSGGHVTTRDALLPSALAAMLLALLVYGWLSLGNGNADAGRVAGMLGALALVMMPAFLGQARSAEMDMLLALACALAFFGWERYRFGGRRWGVLLFYAALGLGFSIKGHVALLVLLPAVWLWDWREKKRGARPAPPQGAAKFHALGWAILLLLILPWAIPFARRSGITWNDFYREGLNRVGESTGHREPFYFYLLNIPGWTLPWCVVLPFAAWMWGSRKRSGAEEAAAPRRRLWWFWFGTNLLFWSLLSAKQRHYAVPWLIPLALLAGEGAADLLAEARRGEPELRSGAALWGRRAVLAVGVCSSLGILAAASWWWGTKSGAADAWALGTGALAALGFALGTWRLARPDGPSPFSGWWAGAIFALIFYAGTLEKEVDRSRSPEPFCAKVRAHVPDGAPLYDLGVARPHILFYLGRNVKKVPLPKPGPAWQSRPKQERQALRFAQRTQAVRALLVQGGSGVYVLAGNRLRDALPSECFTEPFSGERVFAGHKRGAHLLRGRERP